MYLSTKTYGTDRGLSCCFRQWAAESHCNQIHGYSLGFKFVFAAEQLDHRNWVIDFGKGGFGPIKEWLHYMFDHTLLVADDDPEREDLIVLGAKGLAEVRLVKASGCEMTSKLVFDKVNSMVVESTQGRCWLESVEVSEHGANSAIYRNPQASKLRQQVEDFTSQLGDD